MKTLQNVQKLRNTHTDSLRTTGFEMLNKSKKIDFTKGIAEAYFTIAQAYWGWNFYDTAIYYCRKALKGYESIHDTLSTAHKQLMISIYYSEASRIEEAVGAINKSRYYYECMDNISLKFMNVHIFNITIKINFKILKNRRIIWMKWLNL
jgi:tetratricopeptide (TPR) repeat protein